MSGVPLAPEPSYIWPVELDYYNLQPTPPVGGILTIQIDEIQTALLTSGRFSVVLTLTPKGDPDVKKTT